MSDTPSVTKVRKDAKESLTVKVEVEPRSMHTKSHAGIFVRTGGKNITAGRRNGKNMLPPGLSADAILQEIQWKLKDCAELQVCKF